MSVEVVAMRAAWLVQIAVVVLVPALIYALSHRGDRATALKGAGMIVTGTFGAFFAVMLAGETFGDPGGWASLGWTAAWLVPMAGLSVLAWQQPAWGVRALTVVAVAVLAALGWAASDPSAWQAIEETRGPLGAVLTFLVIVPAAVLGWRRARPAGLILLAMSVLPVLLTLMFSGGVGLRPSTLVVTAPAAITGVLYLLSAATSSPTPTSSVARPLRAGGVPKHAE
jgi:hypothetical protein